MDFIKWIVDFSKFFKINAQNFINYLYSNVELCKKSIYSISGFFQNRKSFNFGLFQKIISNFLNNWFIQLSKFLYYWLIFEYLKKYLYLVLKFLKKFICSICQLKKLVYLISELKIKLFVWGSGVQFYKFLIVGIPFSNFKILEC